MSRGHGLEGSRVDRADVMTPSHSGRSVSTANSHNPHPTSYQLQLAQGHHRDRDEEQRAHHRRSRQSLVPSPTPSPHFARPPTPSSSFRRPSPSQYHRSEEQETFYEAQYSTQQLARHRRHTTPPHHSYDETAFPPNSQRPPGPYTSRQHYDSNSPRPRAYVPVDSVPPSQQPVGPKTKTGSKATVEIFNKLLQLEHDVGDLRSEVLHIRDNNHDLKTSLRAMPTREELREELRDILTSTLQETTASLTTTLSTSLTSSIAESVKESIGSHVTEAVEKAVRASTQSLPAITAHLVCEKTKSALGDTEKSIEASVRSTLKSVQPQTFAPPGGTMANLLRPINDLKTAFDKSGIVDSMRFVAGVADQLNTKMAQLQVATVEAVQSRPAAPDGAIQDALSTVDKKIEAISSSLADLYRDAEASRGLVGTISSLESSVTDMKADTDKLGSIEQRLGVLRKECSDNSAQHASVLQQIGGDMKNVIIDSSGIAAVGRQLSSIEADLHRRLIGAQDLGIVVLQDLSSLKESATELGQMSRRVEDLVSSVETVKSQCHQQGAQLQRLQGMESDLRCVKNGAVKLQELDQKLAAINAFISNCKETEILPHKAAVTLLPVSTFTRAPGINRTLESPPATSASQTDSDTSEALTTRPSDNKSVSTDAILQTHSSASRAGSVLVNPTPTASPSLTFPPLASEKIPMASPPGVTATAAVSALHLLSDVASQAASSRVPATSAEAASAASSDPNGIPRPRPNPTTTLPVPTSQGATSDGPLAPTIQTPPVSGSIVDPTEAAARPTPRKRDQQKWKTARPGTRRSSRIQARADRVHDTINVDVDATERTPAGRPSAASSDWRAGNSRIATSAEADIRSNPQVSGIKRKAPSESEERSARRRASPRKSTNGGDGERDIAEAE